MAEVNSSGSETNLKDNMRRRAQVKKRDGEFEELFGKDID